MGAIRTAAEKLWSGETTTRALHPMAMFLGLEEYRPGLAFVASFANVTAIATGEGLVLVDTGSAMAAAGIQAAVRAWSAAPVHTAVFTHGHIDHVMGVDRFEAEARPAGAAPLRVVAHEAIRERFARYRLTAGYNAAINARQFALPGLRWPTEYRLPDLVYRDRLTLEVGGETLELHHDRGETDDHTWLWLPRHRALVTGDLFIWASPNCGNPQKAQRYPAEWARALRAMAELRAELLLPGHGPPIEGAARVAEALGDTAALLESLCRQTLALLNQGAPLDTILAEVRAPDALLARPYLRPVYDEPEFVVRNLVRQLAGWWDGNPARLKPPRDGALAAEVAALTGGPGPLIDRARALAAAGDHALACQLAEWARAAAPADEAIRRARAEIYRDRAAREDSLMARNIFRAAADD
ncbi:MAG TPA: alkyl sulfatase dimerization domain-containing protein [Kofleriaceae bacterium]|nr:alkyl sulfatase dimerization domain-containing protein [Kofleriaceae bacterium]